MVAANAQVLTDETRVKQIIMNGLTNAVKYSNAPANGAVRIAIHVESAVAAVAAVGRGSRSTRPPDTRSRVAAAGPRAVRAPGETTATGPGVAADAAAPWLVIEVLDRGPGLRGVNEDVLFVDFLAPVVQGGTPYRKPTADTQSGIHIGSSGVGLPVCARCAVLRAARVTMDKDCMFFV